MNEDDESDDSTVENEVLEFDDGEDKENSSIF